MPLDNNLGLVQMINYYFRVQGLKLFHITINLILSYSSNPWEWLASNFSLQDCPWIEHLGYGNKGNDQQLKKFLIVKQILLSRTLGNVKGKYGEYPYWRGNRDLKAKLLQKFSLGTINPIIRILSFWSICQGRVTFGISAVLLLCFALSPRKIELSFMKDPLNTFIANLSNSSSWY